MRTSIITAYCLAALVCATLPLTCAPECVQRQNLQLINMFRRDNGQDTIPMEALDATD